VTVRSGQAGGVNAVPQELDGFATGAGRLFVASACAQVRAVTDTDAPRSVVAVADKIGKCGWCRRLVTVV
jgi:hypothetical protein